MGGGFLPDCAVCDEFAGESLSSVDFPISSSSEACNASSWAPGWGDRGGRTLLAERADDRRDNGCLASWPMSSRVAAVDDSVVVDNASPDGALSFFIVAFRRA